MIVLGNKMSGNKKHTGMVSKKLVKVQPLKPPIGVLNYLTGFISTGIFNITNDLDKCQTEINEILCKKKWFKYSPSSNTPVVILHHKLVFDRHFAEYIYGRYDKKYYVKLDKFLLQIIDDVLEKCDIKEFGYGFSEVIDTVKRNYIKKDNGKWYVEPIKPVKQFFNVISGTSVFKGQSTNYKKINYV